ncbi:MAG: F0F1 ATP synthase subunit delta [Bacillota bacterium]|nr:F0F1 ATP synthase subunit delta [Bacillota bacterium]
MENWRRRVKKDSSLRSGRRPAAAEPETGKREREPVKATVRTAQPLTPEMTEMLAARLQKFSRQPVEVVNVVDPAVVAGMVVQLGSRLVDMSLQGQLNELERRIEKALAESMRTLSSWDVSVEELIKRARAQK